MNCENCGTQREEDLNYCRQCGQTFPELEIATVPVSQQPEAFRILQSLTGTDLSHDRVSAILRQVIGLIALMLAVFAITKKPDPGIFILYAIPALLGGVVIVLERKASIGKAMFVLAMLIPYFSLFLVGVPPILVSGVQNLDSTAAGLAGFFGCVSMSVAFLVAGFLFIIFSSIMALIVTKKSLIAGGSALVLTMIFTIIFMSLLGNPNAAVAQSLTIVDKLDKGVTIHTTALAPDTSGKLTETKKFMSNELIYTYTGGLTASARFGFRVTDLTGKVVIPFDRSKAAQAKGVGLDKFEAFNTADVRLDPGTYNLELMVAQGWRTTVAARTSVVVLADVNPNYGVQTTDPYSWLALASGVAQTKFKKEDAINIVLDGSRLQNDISVIIKGKDDKIVLDKSYSAMPLGKSQYVIANKASDLGQGDFIAAISSEGKDSIIIYFTIE